MVALPTWLASKKVIEFLELEEILKAWQFKSLIFQVVTLKPLEKWALLDDAGFSEGFGLNLDFLSQPTAPPIPTVFFNIRPNTSSSGSSFSLGPFYFFHRPNCTAGMITQGFINAKKVSLSISRLNNSCRQIHRHQAKRPLCPQVWPILAN